MSDPFFFGYGSLVNRATHSYAEAYPAVLTGWRRAWRGTAERPVAFLTGERDPTCQISGLIAHVPGADWAALDARERGYARGDVTKAVRHDVPRPLAIEVFAVPPETYLPDADRGIYLSYLDVVVQGYLQEFGAEGVAEFFATTTGWETPVWDDRAQPLYPRHQVLTPQEQALCDSHLSQIGARVEPLPR